MVLPTQGAPPMLGKGLLRETEKEEEDTMKKLIAMLLTLALVLYGAAAVAEEGDPVAFNPYLLSGWDTADGQANMLIEENPDGSGWDVEITSGEGEGAYVFMATIHYDAALDRFVYDEGKYWDLSDGASEASDGLGEPSVAGATGSFALSGDLNEGRLEWVDDQRPSESVVFIRQPSDYTYYPEMEACAGDWQSGDYSLEIVHSLDDYNLMNCVVTRMTGEREGVRWIYDSCAYDDVGNALSCEMIGMKFTFTLDDSGDLATDEEIFTDGAASFKLNDDGTLTWTDYKEAPGEDTVVFERKPQ